MTELSTTPRFGLMDQGWADQQTSDAEAIAQSLATVRLADELGFDSSWIGEHHHVRPDTPFYGRVPASEVFLAYAAAQTKRITLGTGVRILSTTPALRTAEEMSLLTLLSGGRTEFGIGLGSGQHGLLSGEEKAALFRKLLTELLAILDNDPSTGLPPLSPRPPAGLSSRLWAAARDPVTIDLLVEKGVNLVVGQAEVGQSQAEFVRHYQAGGGTGRSRGVRLVFVAETHQEAIERSRAAVDLYFKLMANNGYRLNAVAKGYLPAEIKTREDMLLHINFICGTPAEVAAELNRYIATTGVDQLDFMVKVPLLELADVHRSMRLLQAEVIPLLDFGQAAGTRTVAA